MPPDLVAGTIVGCGWCKEGGKGSRHAGKRRDGGGDPLQNLPREGRFAWRQNDSRSAQRSRADDRGWRIGNRLAFPAYQLIRKNTDSRVRYDNQQCRDAGYLSAPAASGVGARLTHTHLRTVIPAWAILCFRQSFAMVQVGQAQRTESVEATPSGDRGQPIPVPRWMVGPYRSPSFRGWPDFDVRSRVVIQGGGDSL